MFAFSTGVNCCNAPMHSTVRLISLRNRLLFKLLCNAPHPFCLYQVQDPFTGNVGG